jgi:hypothetical protein
MSEICSRFALRGRQREVDFMHGHTLDGDSMLRDYDSK